MRVLSSSQEQKETSRMLATNHWIHRIADDIEARTDRVKGEGAKIICASGISPSGPIHLGNLREVMTVHLITEVIRKRGRDVEHIHFWDDYDRLRKIPKGIPERFSEHIGRPISDIPDPFGEYESYALRFMSDCKNSLEQLGITPTYVKQSEAYKQAIYREHVIAAFEERHKIFNILADYQRLHNQNEDELQVRQENYYPFRVYCEYCGHDFTEINRYDSNANSVEYSCQCGHMGKFSLREKTPGKLLWKIDWPMRWFHAKVDFEPGGEDHSAPGSSFTVGQRIVRDVFAYHAPHYVGYAFVGMSGNSKISSSAGTSATPSTALKIFEAPILRWLYIRKEAKKAFNIEFGKEMFRVYDEWDRFVETISSKKCSEQDKFIYQLSCETSMGKVLTTKKPVSFRILASAADITQGNQTQIVRIVSEHSSSDNDSQVKLNELEPRLTCAINWALEFQPEEERTYIRDAFDKKSYQLIDPQNRKGLQILLERMDEFWSLDGLTLLVYGTPKILLDMPLDAKPTLELKKLQRSFFKDIYQLICGQDTGPRLPTLFLSIGKEKVRALLEYKRVPLSEIT